MVSEPGRFRGWREIAAHPAIVDLEPNTAPAAMALIGQREFFGPTSPISGRRPGPRGRREPGELVAGARSWRCSNSPIGIPSQRSAARITAAFISFRGRSSCDGKSADDVRDTASRILPAIALDIVPGLKIQDIVEPPGIAQVVDPVGPHPAIALLTQRRPPPAEIIPVHRPPQDDDVVVPKLPQSCGD